MPESENCQKNLQENLIAFCDLLDGFALGPREQTIEEKDH